MGSLYSNYITKNESEYVKYNIDIRKILASYGLGEEDGEWFHCPNPNHKDTHPSAHYTNNEYCRNAICCFTCPDIDYDKECICYDTIQVWAMLNNLDKKKDYVRICKELIAFDEDNYIEYKEANKDIDNTYKETKKVKTDEDYQKDIEYIKSKSKSIHDLHNEHKFFLDNYLNKRAINYEKIKPFLEKFNVTIRHRYLNNINRCYIDINDKLILSREIEDYLKNDDTKAHQKQNFGRANFSYFNNNSKTLLVFEGFYDLLSYLSNTTKSKEDLFLNNYLVLNSTKTLKKFLEYDYENNILLNLDFVVLLLDNDAEGKKATNRLIEELEEVSTDYEVDSILEKNNVKDVNEYFIKQKKERK